MKTNETSISRRKILLWQVRLQEIWRDRREELSVGLGRVEQVNNNKRFKTSTFIIEYPLQHYEHLLNESSTEISELESSIELKYQAISKMQVQNTIKSDT